MMIFSSALYLLPFGGYTIGLLDEVSVMIGGGIDGRAGMTAVFDGIRQTDYPPVLLTLNDVERMGNTVWLRYSVNK